MNLRKQVEPLLSAALQASSKQRRAQRATSRLAWVVTLAQTSPRNHHEQSRSVPILLCPPWGVNPIAPGRWDSPPQASLRRARVCGFLRRLVVA
jgi:hypothetical protein